MKNEQCQFDNNELITFGNYESWLVESIIIDSEKHFRTSSHSNNSLNINENSVMMIITIVHQLKKDISEKAICAYVLSSDGPGWIWIQFNDGSRLEHMRIIPP